MTDSDSVKIENISNDLTERNVKAFVTRDLDVKVFDEVTSTNDLAKEASLRDGAFGKVPLCIVADMQTAGRGRLGRSFASPAGTGLYMSFAFEPRFDISGSLFVTMAAAVGTIAAIKKVTGEDAGIKWVNDLYIGGKKVCGILTEEVAAQGARESGRPDARERLVVGIGVNCFPGSFPPEIKDIAGPISKDAGSFSRAELAGEMINEVLPLIEDPEGSGFMAEYRKNCFILGKHIKVHRSYNDEGVYAEAVDITADGGLLVRYEADAAGDTKKAGTEEVLHTGEISIEVR